MLFVETETSSLAQENPLNTGEHTYRALYLVLGWDLPSTYQD